MVDIVLSGKQEDINRSPEKVKEEIAEAKKILDFLLDDPSYYDTWLLGVWDWHDNARSFSGHRAEAEGLLKIWRTMTGVKFL